MKQKSDQKEENNMGLNKSAVVSYSIQEPIHKNSDSKEPGILSISLY